MNPFPDQLHLDDGGMRGHSRMFVLSAPFTVRTSKGTVILPRGLVSDGASIPECFWSWGFSPYAEYYFPSLFHDWGYSKANIQFNRSEVDLIFLELMHNVGVPWPKRGIIYRAVRMFGARSYKGFKK